MATYDYDLVVNGAKISIHHEEKEKVGEKGSREFNPKKLETLSLKVGQETFKFGTGEFKAKQAALKLPNFADLNLKWFEPHRVLFPTGATLEQQETFSKIQEFCKEKGVDLEKAISILPKVADLTKARQKLAQNSLVDASERADHLALLDKAAIKNIDQKLKALAVICVVLSLKTNTPQSFYNSKIPQDQKTNKKYIDTILTHFTKDEIKIGVSTAGAKFGSAGYVDEWDTFFVSSDFSINSLLDRSVVVHELFHAFQDSTEKEESRKTIEARAHQKSSEYILHELGLSKTKKTSRDQINDLIKKNLPQLAEEKERFFPAYHALWVAYDRLMNDPKLSEDQGKLERMLELNECFGVLDQQNISQLIQGTIGKLQASRKINGNEYVKAQIEITRRTVREGKEKAFGELVKLLKVSPKFYHQEAPGLEIRKKISVYYNYVLLEFALDRYSELLSGGGIRQSEKKRQIDLLPTRAQSYDLLKAVVDLEPFSKLYGKWNGVY